MASPCSLSQSLAGSLAVLCIGLMPSWSAAQQHEQTAADHVVQAQTFRTQELPPQVLDELDIKARPGIGLIEVTILENAEGLNRTEKADVEVHARSFGGVDMSLKMRELVTNGSVSYLAPYFLLPSEALVFHVRARPVGSVRTIDLQFHERLGRYTPPK